MNMWYFSTWGNHFFHFFIWILFVAENEAVDCDKGNFPVKDKSVLISIDDLVADKIGGQSTDVTRRSNTEGHVVEGNGILFSFISYIFYHYFRPIFHQVMSCSFPPLFSFSVDGFTYSTPAIIAPAPTKKIGSSTPRTRLRRVRVIQPSKSLLPPFSCITSSKKEDSIYQKVIIHTRNEEKSKIKEYSFLPLFNLSQVL